MRPTRVALIAALAITPFVLRGQTAVVSESLTSFGAVAVQISDRDSRTVSMYFSSSCLRVPSLGVQSLLTIRSRKSSMSASFQRIR